MVHRNHENSDSLHGTMLDCYQLRWSQVPGLIGPQTSEPGETSRHPFFEDNAVPNDNPLQHKVWALPA